MIKKLILIVTGLIILGSLLAQDKRNNYQAVSSGSYLRDKNFYFFSILDREKEIRIIIDKDSLLTGIAKTKRRSLQVAAELCNENLLCHTDKLRFSDLEVELVANRLESITIDNKSFRKKIIPHLRNSGFYENYQSKTDAQLVRQAFTDAAKSINRIIDVYALGVKAKYAAIDSASYDVNSSTYRQNINIIVSVMHELSDSSIRFYEAPLDFSLKLLSINMRDEAGRFEPLILGENKKAIANINTIKWNNYPYSTILIPGAGPDIISAKIDPWAESRIELAVDRFRRGQAPLIIVSGGFVKPFQTIYCEAMEMKKILMQQYGIPEKNILLEPFARHTTTNLRNGARLILEYKVPREKKILIISDMYQTKTIQSPAFEQRCKTELGFTPFIHLFKKSKYETEMILSVSSLHRNAFDPLDP